MFLFLPPPPPLPPGVIGGGRLLLDISLEGVDEFGGSPDAADFNIMMLVEIDLFANGLCRPYVAARTPKI